MSAGGGRAGTGYIEIRPELVADFNRQLQQDVDRKTKPVEVPVEPDTEEGGKKAGEGVKSWGADLDFTAAAGAVGAIAGKFIVDGAATWIEEGKGAARIATALGLDAKGKASVEAAAEEVYKDGFGGSLADAQLAVEAVGSTLIDVNSTSRKDLIATAEAAQMLADVFGVDVAVAASAAKEAADEFGMSGADSLDMLAASMQGVDVSLRGDLLEALTEYTPMLHEMGYSAEEAFGVFVTAAKEGKFELDKMPDAVKELHNRMMDFGDTTSNEALMGLGIPDPIAFKKRIMAGGDEAQAALDMVLTELMAKKNDPRAKMWAQGIFGTQFEDLASIDTLALLKPIDDALGQTKGKAAEMGKQSADSYAGSWDAKWRQMEIDFNNGLDRIAKDGIGKSLGALVEQFENNFTALGEPIGGFFDKVEEWFGEIPGYLGGAWEHIENFLGEIPGWLGGLWEQIEDLFGKIPQGIGAAFDPIEEMLTAPFKAGWNFIAGWFNGLQFPTIGPWDIDAGPFGSYTIGPYGGWDLPDLPTFDRGGVVPGTIGSPQLILAHGGETVLPTHKADYAGATGGVVQNWTINTTASPAETAQVASALMMRRLRGW